MPDVSRLYVRQHGKECPRAADRVCQGEPVGKMELSNHGEGLLQFMHLHGGQNLPLCQKVMTPIISLTHLATVFQLLGLFFRVFLFIRG